MLPAGPDLASVAAAPADVVVIGGGIVGAGVARDAAMRGLRTVLVEARDLAWGTSSRSSRLIHGGLRYLEQGHLHLVFEALAERAVLGRIAPHLVRPLPFVFPLYAGDRVAPWKLGAGLLLYDLLARTRKETRHQRLGKRALLAREPALRALGLRGGARYFDAQCDDARLTIATARSAAAHGARVLPHTAVAGFVRAGGRLAGVALEDRLGGARATLAATVIVNATGPWTDATRRLADPEAPPLLRVTKGVHVVVPRARLGHHEAITLLSPLDGRVMFVLPWGAQSIVGTTDTDTAEAPDAVAATRDDVTYLLRSANALFPSAHLTEDDVLATWAGLRPLVADGAGGPSSVSREHVILEEASGLVTVAGGKLTTYRRMGAQVVDRVIRRVPHPAGGRWPRSAPTDREPLPGGESPDVAPLRALADGLPLADATVAHLLRHYGTEAAALFNAVRADAALAAPLHPAHPAVAAEVSHAARHEFARTVEDVLVRRLHLFYETPDRGAAAAEATARLLAATLGWDAARSDAEVTAYQRLATSDPAARGG